MFKYIEYKGTNNNNTNDMKKEAFLLVLNDSW